MQKFATLIIALLSLITLACESKDGTPADGLTITSSTNIEVGRYAGEFTISYIADTLPEISTTAGWLNVKSNENGKATIIYDTNPTEGIRQAAIVLSTKARKATVVVTQSNQSATPTISLIGESNIELDRCGQLVDIEYTIENRNPIDYVYAKTSAEWIYSGARSGLPVRRV